MVMAAMYTTHYVGSPYFASDVVHRAWRGLRGLISSLYSGAFLPNGQCLDATILAAGINEIKNTVEIQLCGDGVAVIEFVDGNREVYAVEYSDNAPYYPSYKLASGREEYYTAVGTLKQLDSPGSSSKQIDRGTYAMLSYDIARVARVTLMTDGAMAFTSRDGSIVNPLHIINELTAYKGTEGPFVKRRMRMGLKSLAKQGLVQNDDLTVACMCFNHTKEEAK
jgi:hypothetical protein